MLIAWRDRMWQAAVAAVALLGLVLLLSAAPRMLASVANKARVTIGATHVPLGPLLSRERVIMAITPGGPAERAGLAVGDHVTFVGPSRRLWGPEDHSLLWRHHTDRPNELLSLELDVQVLPDGAWITPLVDFSYIWSVPLAMLVAWRRPRGAGFRFLAMGLALYGYGGLMPFLDPLPLRVVATVAFGFAASLSQWFLMMFVLHNAGLDWRKPVWRVLPTAVGMMGLVAAAAFVGSSFNMPIPYAQQAIGLTVWSGYALIASGLWIGWRRRDGPGRERFRWMAASFAALAVADMVNWTPFGFIPSPALWMLIGVMYAVAGPLLVYAVLRNQVLDFAFAVNRTAAFGATSLALIGAFAALNAGIERLLHLQVGEGSRWLDIGLAFGLAIIAARLRRLIERVIERTLFRSWRERERRMQEWLERLPSHLEAPSLLMALKDEASHFTGSTCEAYLATPDGSYAAQGHAVLAADDPLAVAMRATGRAQKGNGAIGLAVPMRHGAALQGFLALGRKPEGGTFRPDEIALLEEAARSTANQWQTLRMASQDRDMAQLRTRLEESREALALIGTRMGMRLISINDLSEIRGGGEEVARPVLWNYRGATSESISIEKVI